MAQPVWILSVDLQTKTATFQTGLADAAKAARGSFNDIKGGAGEAGGAVSYSMGEARHSVMMLTEEFGGHIPRALATFIAGLGPIGPALAAAFPFAAIALGATLFLEHLQKMREAGEKVTESQEAFGLAIQKAFGSLDDKILEAQAKVDDLHGNHLAALNKRLELIDHQSMAELASQFDGLAEKADRVFGLLKTAWYEQGIGSKGAQNALTEFKAKYDMMLATGDKAGAHGLLSGTLADAQKLLGLQNELKGAGAKDNGAFGMSGYDPSKYTQAVAAYQELKKNGIGFTDKEVQSQENLVRALQATEMLEQKVATHQKAQDDGLKGEFAQRQARAAEEATRKQEEAVRKSLEAVHEQNEAAIQAAEQRVKSAEDEQKNAIARTQAGSQQRLDLIRDFIDQDESLGLEDTAQYRSLLEQRNQLAKELDEQNAKQRLQSAEESAKGIEDQLKETLKNQQAESQLKMKGGSPSELGDLGQMRAALDAEYTAKKAAYEKEAEAYRAAGMEQTKEAQAVHRQMLDADRQYADQKKQLQDKEAADTTAMLVSMQNQYLDTFSHVLFGRESLTRAMGQLADQDITNAIKAALQYMETGKSEQLSAAKAAAAKAYNAMAGIPIVGPELGAVAAAAVFAGALAFEKGGIVPGVGKGDVVPAMLSPGEGIVPGGVMDGLRNIARNGGFDGHGNTTVVHVRPTYHVNTIDGDGMQAALEKHTDQLQRHFENTLRRMNR